jgi:hypothetical protein
VAVKHISAAANALAWSQWVDLGVPGTVEARHSFLHIDLEALVWLTGSLDDARLREEAMDWLLQYGRLFSISRLRSLAKLWPSGMLDDMIVTVGVESKELRWKVHGHLLPFKPRRHSRLDLTRRSAYTLRLRTLIGVDARADVLSALLCARAPLDHAELTERAGYSKRAVISAVDALVEGGFVDRVEFRNRFLHSVDAAPWTQMLGSEAPTWTPWRDVYLVLLRAAQTERMHPDPNKIETEVAWANLQRGLSESLARIELFSPHALSANERRGRDSFIEFAQRMARGIA